MRRSRSRGADSHFRWKFNYARSWGSSDDLRVIRRRDIDFASTHTPMPVMTAELAIRTFSPENRIISYQFRFTGFVECKQTMIANGWSLSSSFTGPCGGKTTGQARLCTFFENLGWKVNELLRVASSLLEWQKYCLGDSKSLN